MALKTDAALRKDQLGARYGATLEHRHFAVIAGILKERGDDPATVADWADRLRHTNPRFDRERFILAATSK